MNKTIRAERATVEFFDGLQVDGYRMPNGEFRVGIAGSSRVLGYGREWLGRVLKRGGNTVKALQGMGFTEEIQKVATQSIRGGGTEAQTISLDDFNRLIVYAVMDQKPAALALQMSLTKLSLNDFFREAFGEEASTIQEKRQLFYETYASTLNPQEWLEMDRDEILNLALPGDEEQIAEGAWNQSFLDAQVEEEYMTYSGDSPSEL